MTTKPPPSPAFAALLKHANPEALAMLKIADKMRGKPEAVKPPPKDEAP